MDLFPSDILVFVSTLVSNPKVRITRSQESIVSLSEGRDNHVFGRQLLKMLATVFFQIYNSYEIGFKTLISGAFFFQIDGA
jgi:hypothetical protein